MLAVLAACLMMMPGANALSLAEDRNMYSVDTLQREFLHLLKASARPKDQSYEGRMNSLKQKLQKVPKGEMPKLAQALIQMFSEKANMTALRQFKNEHVGFAESLVQKGVKVSKPDVGPDEIGGWIGRQNVLSGKGMPQTPKDILEATNHIVPNWHNYGDPNTIYEHGGAAAVGQGGAAYDNFNKWQKKKSVNMPLQNIPYFDVGFPNHPFDATQLAAAVTRPEFLCYFYDLRFDPCSTFNVCLGMVMSATTLPPTWAKTLRQRIMQPLNQYVRFELMRRGLNVCGLANSIVAVRTEPLAGLIWNAKTMLQEQSPKLMDYLTFPVADFS